MSKIQAAILAKVKLQPKRGEDRQAFLERVVLHIGGVDDPTWDSLDEATQDWYNEAADAYKAKAKTLPDFPDAEPDEPAEPAKPAGRSRASSKPAAEERLTKVGDTATVVNSRDQEFTGEVVEIDDKVIVLEIDGNEKEFLMERVKSVTVNNGDAGGDDASADEPDADPVKLGAMLEITNKRDKVTTGKVVEIEDDLIILEVDGKDVEIMKDRIATIKVVGAEKEDPAPETPSRRRGDTKATEPAADADKPKRSSNPAGISVGGRIREIMCADLGISEEAVGKQLKKDGIEFRDTSLRMIFKDTNHVFDELKKNKKLK